MCAFLRAGGCAVGWLGLFVLGMSQVNAQFIFRNGDTEQGRVLFERVWKSSTTLAGGDGLGPMFNERSCVACHYLGGIGGAGPNGNNVDILSVAAPKDSKSVVRWSERVSGIHPGFSATTTNLVLHRFSSSADYPEFRERVLGLTPPPGKPEQQLIALSAVRVQQGDGPIKKGAGLEVVPWSRATAQPTQYDADVRRWRDRRHQRPRDPGDRSGTTD